MLSRIGCQRNNQIPSQDVVAVAQPHPDDRPDLACAARSRFIGQAASRDGKGVAITRLKRPCGRTYGSRFLRRTDSAARQSGSTGARWRRGQHLRLHCGDSRKCRCALELDLVEIRLRQVPGVHIHKKNARRICRAKQCGRVTHRRPASSQPGERQLASQAIGSAGKASGSAAGMIAPAAMS